MVKILIIDFGGPYAARLASTIRSSHTAAVIVPGDSTFELLQQHNADGIILADSPHSVYDAGSPELNLAVIWLELPMLAIGYGLSQLVQSLDGLVRRDEQRHAHIYLERTTKSSLLPSRPQAAVMCVPRRYDQLLAVPAGFTISAYSGSAIMAIEDTCLRIFGVQFDPLASKYSPGSTICDRFLSLCGAAPTHFQQTQHAH